MTGRFHPLPWFPLAVWVLAGLLAWLRPQMTFSTVSVPQGETGVQEPAKLQAPSNPVEPPVEAVRADGKQVLQAYRLAVRSGVVTLDGSTRIVGDFHRRRGPQAWMPGMWCVRLLDADMKVLAEETANAPDDVCLVGDPQSLSANGKPQVTQFAGAGEEAMLQVRLPPQPGAKWLKVYRIGSLQRADWNTEPMGQLLASISLP
jgi:hypothetical protein